MSNLPKRYQFDNELPVHRPIPLPERRVTDTNVSVGQAPTVIEQHYHEAAQPDRVLQRVALGAGMGGGAVAAGVYFLPMLIIAVQSLIAALMTLALMLAVVAWAVVTIVQAVGGKSGQAAAKTVRKGRRRRG